jgi:hypothetical protein
MRLGIAVRRWEIGCRVYIAGGGVAGRWQDEVLRLRCGERVQDKTEESAFSVSELESAWVSALGFSAHVFFSRCLFFIYYLFLYIKEKNWTFQTSL